MRKVKSGGGWQAIRYTLKKSREAGGIWKMYRALRSKNACKTCALGMGGQRGGMVNEIGQFPEVCKKSLQAMAADMQAAIPDSFWKTYSIAQLKRFSPQQLEACGRIAHPLRCAAGGSHYEPITWQAALQLISDRWQKYSANQTFCYFSGRSSNEAGFLLQLFARLYGTNNVNNCSYYCHQASGVGLNSSLGSGTATVVLDDLEKCDCVFLIGGNPASNHPRLMTSLMKLRRRGGQVIVINPVIETGLVNFKIPSHIRSMLFGSPIASLYVQPHIGGDLALLSGVAKRIVELKKHDASFLANYTRGAEELMQHLDGLEYDEVVSKSGVSQDQIFEIADCYAKSESTIFSWTMGVTHHENGVENVQAIANLALLRSMVGRPAAGLMPIRGHSNVQGIGSVGVTPTLKRAIFENLEQRYRLELPQSPGKDTLDCMLGAASGELKGAICLGGNLFGSNPDAKFAERALGNLESVVYMSTTLNTGHAWGVADETIILPVLARDEEPEPTTQESMFNFVRFSDGGPRRLTGPRSEVEVIAALGEQILGNGRGVDWTQLRQTRNIRQMISETVPGFEKMKSIDETREEFQIGGRTFHQPRFATPDGKANLHVHQLPPLKGNGKQLRLMTVRSEGQFNTVVYEESDIYRGQTRRDVILLHPEDIQQMQLTTGQRVTVRNATGQMNNVLVSEFDQIKPGNALMYYPEANVLVPRQIDEQSRTPAFKNVVVEVLP